MRHERHSRPSEVDAAEACVDVEDWAISLRPRQSGGHATRLLTPRAKRVNNTGGIQM